MPTQMSLQNVQCVQAGRVMALCGVREPWLALEVLQRAPAAVGLAEGKLVRRMLALRAALPGA